jgi:hypothetical protein
VIGYSELTAGPNTALVDGYEFIAATVDEPAMCKRWANACDPSGQVACTIVGAGSTLRQSSDKNANPPCGAELTKFP